MERTYEADRFDEAIAKVKRDLGPDAVIVSSRQLDKGLLNKTRRVQVKALSREDAMSQGLIEAESAARPRLLERRLLRMDVPPSASRTIANKVRRNLGEDPPTMTSAQGPLARALAAEMIFSDEREHARVVALVGPTGVGKTTTVAKLAAIAALIEHRSVALVSIDQYRIGGTEQLERYADLIGVPMETAHDGPSLEIALRRLASADLVLVDTAGRSPKDPAAIGAMADTLHGVQEPVAIHLCMPAGIRHTELSDVIDRLAMVRPTKLVMTKLDEAVYHGAIVAAQVESGLPLAWFTTGQRVPEDIERATPERLAAVLCGGDV